MKDLYQLLKTKILTTPSIKTVKVFNNQLKNLKDEKQFRFPAVFVEIDNVTMKPRPGGKVQDVSATIRLHVVNNSPTQSDDYLIYDIKDEVQQYANKYSGDGKFRPLMRSTEKLDINHDNIYSYVIEYQTGWIDVTPPVAPASQVTITSVQLAFDLDIDNPIIRTGDNEFAAAT